MKCRIIRIFFIGLCLLCVVTWAWSYAYIEAFHYASGGGNRLVWGEIAGGKFYLTDNENVKDLATDLYFEHFKYSRFGLMGDETDMSFLGFRLSHSSNLHFWLMEIPLWFPTAFSGALLCLVWRKTRQVQRSEHFP